MRVFLTEDQVRDMARDALNLVSDSEANSGVGQLTKFNKLGFKGNNNAPDGWYLPFDVGNPAIIVETKNSDEKLDKPETVFEILRNCSVVQSKYKNVIGILFNGYEVAVYKNLIQLNDVSKDLEDKKYYLDLFKNEKIDKEKIYVLTAKINNCLHSEFGIKNLYHRMIFTACALVAKRYGATLVKDMNYATFHTAIHSTLSKSLEEDRKQNSKLDLLLEVYSEIKMNSTDNQEAINSFIEWVSEISACINSDNWNGEDVMGIFFNEFNRYKKKSESGQVFTPDHITSLMYRLIDVNQDDVILDAACGSGAFLVKAMCNMMKEAGGQNTKKAKEIKSSQLYGIEFDREIYSLACANMLIHKDGKTNLTQMDSRTQTACSWIESKPITKVLMNPPFETKFGCLTIVENVLDSVKKDTLCAFILPDKKLEKNSGKASSILKHHTLLKIIKLPEETFNAGVVTSIFIFKAGVPQDEKEIFACYIKEDGLETVKNQGRHDIKNKWKAIENKWVDIIHKQSGDDSIQWLDPCVCLSYQAGIKPFVVYEEDFVKTLLDYFMYENNIDSKKLNENVLNKVLYSSEVKKSKSEISINLKEDDSDDSDKQ